MTLDTRRTGASKALSAWLRHLGGSASFDRNQAIKTHGIVANVNRAGPVRLESVLATLRQTSKQAETLAPVPW
jgi:Tfp pilus assembly protein PilN